MKATEMQLNVNKELINLISVYNSPGKIIERDLDLFNGSGHKILLAGDFNAKHVTWRARQSNAAGQTLIKYYYKNNYIISAPLQPKYFPDRIPSGRIS
jgi:hypothetical protein